MYAQEPPADEQEEEEPWHGGDDDETAHSDYEEGIPGAGAATVVVGADVVGAVGAPKLKPEAGAPNVLPVVA